MSANALNLYDKYIDLINDGLILILYEKVSSK